MVIISTSATEGSIQAVSPELGVHFSTTASLGSELATQAGGAGAGVAAAAAGAGGAGACAEATLTARPNARLNSTSTRAGRRARENLNVMVGFLIGRLRAGQSAAASASPVRMRTA